MSSQPVAIFRDGRLWLADGGGAYEPAEPYRVAIMAQTQSTLNCDEARERVKACQTALAQFHESLRENTQ